MPLCGIVNHLGYISHAASEPMHSCETCMENTDLRLTTSMWCSTVRDCDERGLSEFQQCKHSYQMLKYILDDLRSPWLQLLRYVSTVTCVYRLTITPNFCRSVISICGFTHESLNANLEGRALCQCYLATINLPLKHPWTCSTDDVGVLSILRDTSHVQCISYEPATSEKVRCSEMLTGQDPGHTTLPVAGPWSVWLTYHSAPVSILLNNQVICLTSHTLKPLCYVY